MSKIRNKTRVISRIIGALFIIYSILRIFGVITGSSFDSFGGILTVLLLLAKNVVLIRCGIMFWTEYKREVFAKSWLILILLEAASTLIYASDGIRIFLIFVVSISFLPSLALMYLIIQNRYDSESFTNISAVFYCILALISFTSTYDHALGYIPAMTPLMVILYLIFLNKECYDNLVVTPKEESTVSADKKTVSPQTPILYCTCNLTGLPLRKVNGRQGLLLTEVNNLPNIDHISPQYFLPLESTSDIKAFDRNANGESYLKFPAIYTFFNDTGKLTATCELINRPEYLKCIDDYAEYKRELAKKEEKLKEIKEQHPRLYSAVPLKLPLIILISSLLILLLGYIFTDSLGRLGALIVLITIFPAIISGAAVVILLLIKFIRSQKIKYLEKNAGCIEVQEKTPLTINPFNLYGYFIDWWDGVFDWIDPDPSSILDFYNSVLDTDSVEIFDDEEPLWLALFMIAFRIALLAAFIMLGVAWYLFKLTVKYFPIVLLIGLGLFASLFLLLATKGAAA